MVTYGFYNSKHGDRKYNARQMSSIFDGIITDGVYMSIGTCFRVVPGEGMTVFVGVGRAWFNHTWTWNDSILPLTLPPSELIMKRIDAVVLEVNEEVKARKNEIKIIKGTPSKNKPTRPTLINNEKVHQYPLAFVDVDADATEIRMANITSMIGTSSTPYVTGVLETVNIDALIEQWGDQWRQWFDTFTADSTEEMEVWMRQTRQNFHDWWMGIKQLLGDNPAGNLAEALVRVEKFRKDLLLYHAIYDPLEDENGYYLEDERGRPIEGLVIFETTRG